MNDESLIVAVILNYNSSEDCDKCISLLRKQTYTNLKIVIVDNCSNNYELKKIRVIANKYKIQLIENSKNKGYSAGNNIGFKYASELGAEWCMVINPDVEIRDKNYLTKLMHEAKEYKNVALIGTNILLPNGDRQNPMRIRTFLEELLWPVEIIKHHTKYWDHYLDPDISGYCNILHGSCYVISLSFLKEINYLDENVFLYCEEEILGSSVRRFGWNALYLKDVTAYHEHYSNSKGNRKDRMLIYFNSRKYYFENYSQFNRFQLLLLNFSLWTWKIYWLIKG